MVLAEGTRGVGQAIPQSGLTTTCTRRLTFSAGHRVFGHEGACMHLHGHNYEVIVTASGELDSVGRVIDFGVLKKVIGGWLEANWDHAFIYFDQDSEVAAIFEDHPEWKHSPLPMNPTAENMAEFLLKRVCPVYLKNSGVVVVSVQVNETENCSAECSY